MSKRKYKVIYEYAYKLINFRNTTLLQKYNIDYQKYISYMLIAYAFSFPISKAATNLFEVLALLLWIAEGNWREKLKLYTHNLLSLAILGLIGYSLISTLWHGNTTTTLNYIAKYRHLLIIFVFYSSFDSKYMRHIISAFVLAMFVSEIFSYGIFFELIHYKNILPSDPSPFMSHMTYSTVLAFAISVLIVQLFYEKNLRYKFFYIFFTISATINLFINGGRTGQVIYIILIIFILFSLVKNKLKALAGTATILFFTFFLAYNFSNNFHERANELQNDISNMVHKNDFTGSGSARVALNIIGLQTIKDNLLLGTGIDYKMDSIEQYAKKFNFDVALMKNFADYHSTFLTISAQLGIVGIILSLTLIIALFTFPIKNKEFNILSKIFAITFVLFSLTHNTLHTMNPMIFFALFAGYFNALQKNNYKDS